uniref:Uncharacterized protein n=1 Tax=Trichuris muris TaxID=70415 RepID=A0A5S6Q579_TRIMR
MIYFQTRFQLPTGSNHIQFSTGKRRIPFGDSVVVFVKRKREKISNHQQGNDATVIFSSWRWILILRLSSFLALSMNTHTLAQSLPGRSV